ncbi:MAG TPA: glycosyl transferase, partial [Opitutae bacterium]|nr:glycosyl transferase [Opitutae bacterium]
MSLKRSVLEGFIGLLSKLYPKSKGQRPNKIFVLRNNDIGDLLVSTPIFEALKKAHPEAYIIAGVG